MRKVNSVTKKKQVIQQIKRVKKLHKLEKNKAQLREVENHKAETL